jgi:hypothetical protein
VEEGVVECCLSRLTARGRLEDVLLRVDECLLSRNRNAI